MSIPVKDQKILWGLAACRCAFPDCRKELVVKEDSNDPKVMIGEIAHIVSQSDIGPRADPGLPQKCRDSYENLILLCRIHHKLIDDLKEKYTVEILREMKDSHEAWVRENLSNELEGIGWKVLTQESDLAIDTTEIVTALHPDYPEGNIVKLRCKTQKNSWDEARAKLHSEVENLLCEPKNCRFAIFSLARISSAIHLGYLLTSRAKVRYAQFNRDTQSWTWSKETNTELPSLNVTGLLVEEDTMNKEFVIKVSLSAQIRNEQIGEVGLASNPVIEVFAENPSEDWLQSERQVIELGKKFRQIMTKLRKHAPNLEKIHLFYAGPTPGAIAIGRQINPRMNPLVQLYEFDRNQTPNYKQSIALGGG